MYEKCELEEVIQPNLVGPTKKNELRDEFFRIYSEKGFEEAYKAYEKNKE